LGLGTPIINPVASTLVQAAGSKFEVTDSFLSRVKPSVPEGVFKAVSSLKGKKTFATDKEFIDAVTEAAGKPQTAQAETALIRSARSDSMYWIAVLLIALAASGHQAWSANVFTVASDVFPKKALASVTGIGGFVGAVAGMLADYSLGQVLTSSGPSGYFFAFLIAGSCYLLLLGVAHLLMPTMTPLDENLRHVKI
jgi:hypothetical protein